MSKQRPITLLLVLIALASISISACRSSGSPSKGSSLGNPTATSGPGASTSSPGAFRCVPGSIIVSGSTALQPYADEVARSYTAKCPSATITLRPDDSVTGLNDAEYRVTQIGDSDVSAPKTQSDLVDHQVAIVLYAMIVNPRVRVSNISTSDLVGIYTGKIENWSQLGGPNLPITIISRPATSGTHASFKHFILSGQDEHPFKTREITVDSTSTLVQTVAHTSGAIGYASLYNARSAGSQVSVLTIDGKQPSLATVKANEYRLWTVEHMYTKGQASGLAQAFLDYMLSSDALTIAHRLGFVKMGDVPQNLVATHIQSA